MTTTKVAPMYSIQWAIKRYQNDYAKIRNPNYLRHFTIILNHIDSFCQGEYAIENYSIDFVNEFYAYLIEEGLTNNTIYKYISRLNSCLDYVRSVKVEKPIYVDKIALDYKPLSTVQTDSISLNIKELLILESYTPEKQYLENIKDVFLFACYTGLRYSDLSMLKHYHIKKANLENDSYYFIDLRMIKTKTAINVPVLDKAYKIIQKYEGLFDTCLPIISNQNSNVYIKQVCKEAGINEITERVRYNGNTPVIEVKEKNEFITMHTARRTFITLLSQHAETESDRIALQSFVGHATFKTTNIYISKSNIKMVQNLNRAFGENE